MKFDPHSPCEQLTLFQLRFLEDLARTEKLSQTAANLGLSLSAASRTLEKLREAFDNPLLTPHPRGLSSTEVLTRMLPELRKTIEQAQKLFQPPEFDPAALEGTFRVSSRGLAVPEILAYVITRLAREAPRMTLEHRPRTGSVWNDLAQGRTDLALVTNQAVPSAFRSVPLFEIELGVLMRKDHPLVRKYGGNAPEIEDLFSYPRVSMIVAEDQRTASWDRQLMDDERTRKGIICASTSAIELAATIEVSDIIMFAPKAGSAGIRRHYDLVWLPLPAEFPKQTVRHGVMAWSEAQHSDPVHRWMRSLFRESRSVFEFD